MMISVWWLVAAFVAGGCVGVIVTALCVAADLADEATECARPEVTD
jgi:uncharacterized protein involved in exopolysaccharide biosynthesis